MGYAEVENSLISGDDDDSPEHLQKLALALLESLGTKDGQIENARAANRTTGHRLATLAAVIPDAFDDEDDVCADALVAPAPNADLLADDLDKIGFQQPLSEQGVPPKRSSRIM